jgi:hypothetical protein
MVGRLQNSVRLLLNFKDEEMSMRIKIIAVLCFVGVMSGFAVAQSSTSGSGSSGTTSSPTGSTAGSTSAVAGSSSTTGANSTSSTNPRSGIQIPANSGNQNAPVQSVTPSTTLFNSQNLNSTSVFGSSLSGTSSGASTFTGTPTMDQILSTQNDLISSTDSFLNPSTTSTNNRTQSSVLGQTIFGNTLMPGMTNIPIVTVVPSTGPATFGNTANSTTSNSSSLNPQ